MAVNELGGRESRDPHYRVCNFCEAMCGIKVEHDPQASVERAFQVTPDGLDPFSKGSMCPKASALGPLHVDPDRLRQPHMRVGSEWHVIGWDEAYAFVAGRLKGIRSLYGRDAIATYLGNPIVHNLGMLLFVRGFTDAIGSRNVFSATSMDQLPHHFAAHFMFGHEFRIPVPDIDRTNHMIVMGANPLASNGSIMTSAGVTERLRAIQDRGGKLIVIDPRKTETAKVASDHHFIKPGTDAYCLLAFMHVLFRDGHVKLGHLAAFINGFEKLRPLFDAFAPKRVAQVTGLDAGTIEQVASDFASQDRAVLYGRMGLSTQPHGGLCNWLINTINILSGNFDTPGGMMFPSPAIELARVKVQPDAVGRWASRVRGLKEFYGELPVSGMADEFLTEGPGQVRAFVTVCGNPVLSTPGGSRLDAALENIDFMVSIDNYINETTRHADIILPTPSGLEVDHYDLIFNTISVNNNVKFSEALIPVGDDRPFDWQILKELIRRLSPKGPDLFTRFATPRRVVNWGLMLGPYGKLSHPKRWFNGLSLKKVIESKHGISLGPMRPRVPDGLLTQDRKIDLAPDVFLERLSALTEEFTAVSQPPQNADDQLTLIGRRNVNTNNSWMHQYKKLSRSKLVRCTAMINPLDAERLSIANDDDILVRSEIGEIRLPAEVTDTMMPGVICIPHGFGHTRPGTRLSVAEAKAGVSVNDITDHMQIDPVTGNAAFSGQRVTIQATVAPRQSIEVSGKPLTIIYGSRTGNGEFLACEAARQAETRGMVASVHAMNETNLAELARAERLLLICSTYGEGDMPDNAEALWDEANASDAPSLAGTHFSVFALGDTSYETFCQAGRNWDRRLAELGGQRVADRIDSDVDYTDAYNQWTALALPAISAKGDQERMVTVLRPDSGELDPGHNRDNPLVAELADKRQLTGHGSSKETYHYALSHAGAVRHYKAGYIVNVLPINNERLVQELLDVLGLRGDEKFGAAQQCIRDQFTGELDIRNPSRALVGFVLDRSGDPALQELLEATNSARRDDFLYGKDIVDLLGLVPNPDSKVDVILDKLRPLTPRSYSISSGPNTHPNEVHLCVASVRYENSGRQHCGVASTYLPDIIRPGEAIRFYFVPNNSFTLPEDGDCPIIMIGPGTGVAPFRAFLEEHEHRGNGGKTWLFFGERNAATDFLYKDEIAGFQERGVLTRLDLAFSRDQSDKVYVQDRMRENGAEFFKWLSDGAYVFVCGDAERMAKDVDKALHEIVAVHGGMKADEAAAYVEILKRKKRYLRDVY